MKARIFKGVMGYWVLTMPGDGQFYAAHTFEGIMRTWRQFLKWEQ